TPNTVQTVTGGPQYSGTFEYAPGASIPGPQNVLSTDNAGNSATLGFEVVEDNVAPTGSSVTYASTTTFNTSIPIDFVVGVDGAGSGVATHQLQRRSAPFSGTTCGAWAGAWTNLGTTTETSPFADTTTADGFCYQYRLVVTDNVQNVETVASTNEVRIDRTPPTGTINVMPAWIGGTYTVGGTHADTSSGVADFDLTFADTATGDICLAETEASPWNCDWNTTLNGDGPYELTLIVRDIAGNVSGPITATVGVDNGPPVLINPVWTEGTNPLNQHVAGPKLWFNPALAGTAKLGMTATDAGSGVANVSYPVLGTGWSPTLATVVPFGPYEVDYSFVSGAVTNLAATATATDNVGNSSTRGFEVQADGTAPTGSSLSYPSTGYRNTTSVDLTFARGNDGGGSGLGRHQLLREQTTLLNGVCQAGWSAPTNIGALNAPSPYTDATLADGFCYRYTLDVWDNVNNRERVIDLGEVRVDTTVPTGTLDPQPLFVSGSIDVTGVHADAGSGVADFDITFAGTSASGNICAPEVQTSPFLCAWDTASGSVPDGLYTIRLVVRDNAANISVPNEIQVTVDNGDPTIDLDEWIEGTSPLFHHAIGSTMYYNPTTAGSFTLRMDAVDTGSGVNNVSFPPLGAGWTPGAAQLDYSSTYDVAYAWSGGAAVPPAGLVATATDNVLNTATEPFAVVPDTAPPTGSTITYVDTITNGSNASITFAAGTDALSQIRDLNIQRQSSPYLADGTCSATVSAWTTLVTNPAMSPWVDTTLMDGLCYRYRLDVVDNVSNHELVAPAQLVRVDKTKPTGTFNPLSPFVGGTVAVGGTHSDNASGVQRFDLTYSGTASGTIVCDPLQPSPWTCNWNTLAGGDGPYTLTLVVRDNAGNDSDPIVTTVIVDNFPPVIDSMVWTPVGPGTFQYADGTRLWFNPAQTGTARLTVAANDGAGSGVVSASYPALGTTWTPAGALAPAPSPFINDYTWTSGAATALNQSVVVTDFVGNPTTGTFSVEADPDAPTSSTIAYADGYTNTPSIDVTLSRGSDGSGSGIKRHQLQRSSATLTSGTCGVYGGFTDVGGVDTPATYTDTPLADGFCYQYRLQVTDNVGNVETVTETAEVKVDTTDPLGSIDPMSPYVSGSVNVTGAHSDLGSGVLNFDLTYSGTASGSVCSASTQASPWTCAFNTTGLGLPDGPYVLTILVRDKAGNESTPFTRNVIVDNSDPVIDAVAWVEGATPTEQHAVANKLWVNTASISGDASLKVTAHDVGSLVNRIEYPTIGAGWTPAALVSDTTGTPDYTQTYGWTTGFVQPGLQQVRAVDNVGNDAFANFEVVHDGTAPTGSTIAVVDQFTSATSIDVTFAAGTDPVGGSGVSRSQLQRRAGTLAAGTCTMPAPGAGWADLGALNPTSPFADSALVDGTCYEYRLQVWDNVDNREETIASQQVKVDRTAPTGSFTLPNTPYVSGTVPVEGLHGDANSGVKRFDLTFSGTASGTITCNNLQTSPWACTWTTPGIIADGPYTITLLVTDLADNTASFTVPVIVDNTAPAVLFHHWTEGAQPQAQHAIANTMFYRPDVFGTFSLFMDATDAGSGVSHVDFPTLGAAGWTPGSVTVDPSGTPQYEATYSWTANPTVPTDPQVATAVDFVGLSSTAPFRVVPDADGPLGGSIDYPNTPTGTSAANVAVTFVLPTDALSGVAQTQLQRRAAPYTGTTCGVFVPWSNIAPVDTPSPFSDTTTQDGFCYEYQLLTTDNVSNERGFTVGKQVRIDRTAPTGTWNVLPPYIGNMQTLAGTASDGASGLTTVGLWADPGTGPFMISPCDPTTIGPDALNPDPDNWSCDWDTTSAADGAYTLIARIRDAAGNVGEVTTTVTVDNTNPTATLHGFTENTTTAAYHHAIGSTMWYNPLQPGSFTVQVDATDAGSLMRDVAFPNAGAGWSMVPPLAVTGTPYWESTYSYTASPFDNGASALTAVASDNASNFTNVPFTLRPDTTAPDPAIVSYSSGYQSATSVSIGFSGGGDSQSGLSHLQIERRQAALADDVCAAFGGWGPVGGTSPVNPYVDTTVVTDRCYEYRVAAVDNVGNITVTHAGTGPGTTIVKLDAVAPLGAIDPNPPGPVSGTTVVNGTSDDVTTAVKRVDVTYAGVDNLGAPIASGTLCSVVGPPEPTTWSCTWNSTLVPDGVYTLTLRVVDMADNEFIAPTKVVTVDNTPPDAKLIAIVEGASPQYQHVTGAGATSQLYYNPIQSGGFQVQVEATDAGTGMSHVRFPDLDGALSTGWTPDAAADQAIGNPNTPVPACGYYCANYSWVNGATVPTSPVQARAFDQALAGTDVDFRVVADPDDPISGSIDYSDVWNIGSTTAITFNAGTDALSGVRDWAIERKGATVSAGVCDPSLATAVWSDVSGPSPTSPWTDATIADGMCYQYRLRVTDNVSNDTEFTSAKIVLVDRTAPSGTIDPAPTGPILGATNAFTGTATDAASGVQRVEFRARSVADPLDVYDLCLSPVLTPPSPSISSTWGCNWDTTAGTPDGLYDLELTVFDVATNKTAPPITRRILVDNTPPATLFSKFIEGTNPGYQHVKVAEPNRLWINANPMFSGSFRVEVTANDGLGSGMNRVEFPDHGVGWSNTPASRIDLVATAPDVFDMEYTWASGAAAPAVPQTFTAFDNVGLSATKGYEVLLDATGPSGGSVTYPNGWFTPSKVDVYFDSGMDFDIGGTVVESDIASTRVQRRQSVLSAGVCAPMPASWANVSAPNPASPYEDTTIADGFCYEYRIDVVDNVGNHSYFDLPTNTIMVDTTKPIGSISGTPVGPMAGPFDITGTSFDGGSGVQRVNIGVDDGNGFAISNLCIIISPAPTANWTCNFPTTTGDAGGPVPDGTYTITLRVTDNATNQSLPITRTIVVDNTPPAITLKSFTEVTNGQFIYDDMPNSRVWFNPNQSGAFTVDFDVTDAPAGVNRVAFPDLDGAGALWNPSGGTSQTVPGGAGGITYSQPYGWATGATEPNLQSATAFDNAGNSATDDFEVRMDGTAPTGLVIDYFNGYVVPGNAVVTFDEGTDAGAGLSTTQTQLRRRSSAINPLTGNCGAFTGWTTVATDPTSPFTDAGAIEGATGMCYQYQLSVFDRVNNNATVTPVASHELKVATPGVLITQTACSNSVIENPVAIPCDIRVRLNTKPTGPVTITVDGGTQLLPGAATLTFTPADWNTIQTLPVSAIDDALDEDQPHLADVTFTTTSIDPLYNSIVTPPQTFSIVDNDTAGILIGHTSTDTIVTEGAMADFVTVRLTSQPTANVTITGSTLAGMIGPGLDLAFPTTLTFTPINWASDQMLEVQAIDDNLDEGTVPEAATVLVGATSADADYQGLASFPTSLPATVIDNDVANVIWGSTGPFDVTEQQGGKTFTVRLDTIPTANVVINLDVRGVPVRGDQASLNVTQVTFTPLNWNVAQTITVTAIDDAIDETDNDQEWIDVTIVSADPAYGGFPAGPFSVIVDDNDTAGITMVADVPEAVVEGGATATYIIKLDSQPSANVVIGIQPAVAPSQQAQTSTSSITFTPLNWNLPQTITINAIDDFVAEGVHTTTIGHTVVSGDLQYNNWTLAPISVKITDNETAAAVQTRTTLNVFENGATDSYTLQLGSQPSGDVTVVVTGDADAVPTSDARDIDSSPLTVTIVFTTLNWDDPVQVVANAIDDLIAESTPHQSTFRTTMTSATDPAYNTSGVATPLVIADITVNVTDNDVPGIEVEATEGATVVTEDGGKDTYRVRLKSIPAGAVTVRMAPDAQMTVASDTLIFDASNWNVWQAVTIGAIDDFRVEGDHTGQVFHALDSLDPFYDGLKVDPITSKIADNDAANVIITDDDSTLVAEEGACDYVMVSLGAQPRTKVIMRIIRDEQGFASPADTEFTPENWSTPQRVSICAVDDTLVEGNHSTELLVRTYSDDLFYQGGVWPNLLLRIIDNEGEVVTRKLPNNSETVPLMTNRSDARFATYTIKLARKPTANVVIKPVANRYLTFSRKSLVFTPANFSRPQLMRVGYKRGSGGTGTQKLTIRHSVTSFDRKYNRVAVKPVAIWITPKWTPGGIKSAGAPSSANGRPIVSAPKAPAVKAILPAAPAASLVATLPAEAALDAASLVGKVITVGAATSADGTKVAGSRLKLTGVVRQPYATSAEATTALRAARAKTGARATAKSRWVIALGVDRKYHVYTAETTTDPATALETGVTFTVFTTGVVSFYSDTTKGWVARRDTA
ncbi:MAG: Na-Ca exchanger/integrin-beta4, partial [Thermoleophilia bacterium]|nr:Na-Ca exchanger/integrin-beta4 [Thermoleophilia bacterium]